MISLWNISLFVVSERHWWLFIVYDQNLKLQALASAHLIKVFCPATLSDHPQWRHQYQPLLSASLVIWMKVLTRFKVEKNYFHLKQLSQGVWETVRKLYSDLCFSLQALPSISESVETSERNFLTCRFRYSASTPPILLQKSSAACIQCQSPYSVFFWGVRRFCGCENLCFKVMRVVSAS